MRNINSLLQRLALFLIILVHFSCTKMMVKLTSSVSGVKNLKMLINYDLTDTIVFIPMAHVSTGDFFKEVKTLVDSLRTEGYIVHYEEIEKESYQKLTQQERDTLFRKFRVLYDFNMYDDWASSDQKYEIQDNDALIKRGIDINADLPLSKIIELYEYHFGEIKLTECDLNTPLRAEYLCQKKSFRIYKLATGARDEYLFNLIISSPYSKKLILYGATHWYQMYPKLRDSGYKLVKGKI